MKKRTDFVSNSSSSSFVFSTSLKLEEIVDKVLDFTPDKDVKENNAIALKYFADNYTLLFFGYIPLWSEKVNEGTDIEFEENISAFDIFTKDRWSIDYWTSYKDWYKPADDHSSAEKYNEEEAKVVFKKEIMETLTNRAKFYDSFALNVECGKITEDTIKMTEALIECGVDLHYDKDEYETIKKEISEGRTVYYVTMGDDGEGMDAERIFMPRSTGINVFQPKEFQKIIDCKIITKDEEIPE